MGGHFPHAQLELYAARAPLTERQTPLRRLVVLSECSPEYARLYLPDEEIDGVPVVHLSWRELSGLATRARRAGAPAEKRLLDDLNGYLRGLMTMQQVDSNWVYVVVLSHDQAPGWDCSWVEIVTRYHTYFHPAGAGWPKQPPNYIAFRFDGQLQSIHHIESYEVVRSLIGKHPGNIDDSWNPDLAPHFLYSR